MKEKPYSYDKYLCHGLFMLKKAFIFFYPISPFTNRDSL